MAQELSQYLPLLNDANLKAYWKLENTSDSKGSYTLTNSGMSFVSAKFNNGASSNGTTTNYLTRADAIGTTDTGNKTVMFWVKLNAEFSGTNKDDRFINIFWDATNTGMSVGYERVSNVNYLKCEWDRNGTAADKANYSVNLGTTIYNHIALTASGRSLTLYLNGVSVATLTGTAGSGASQVTDQFRILQWNNTLDCIFDDMAVFDRVLSATEISNYYASNSGAAFLYNFI